VEKKMENSPKKSSVSVKNKSITEHSLEKKSRILEESDDIDKENTNDNNDDRENRIYYYLSFLLSKLDRNAKHSDVIFI
jgi:hypothetical protein